MSQLAIKGHATRGKEVIEILEMLGGKNRFYYDGTFKELIYTINSKLELDVFNINSPSIKNGYTIFTINEFLEKFPYKVGDKVMTDDGDKANIVGMVWDNDIDDVFYEIRICNGVFKYPKELLQPDREQETMKESTINLSPVQMDGEQIIIPIPKGYEFAGVDDDMQQVVLEKIKPKYPNTYVECCKVLDIQSDWHLTLELNTYASSDLCVDKEFEYVCKLEAFRKLLICRNAYWKLAGEEMGLDEPWEPEYTEGVVNTYYTIHLFNNKLFLAGTSHRNSILSFPSEEMRDVFYENFKDLIEDCKKLL